ncbi:hypothetical protein POTOM_060982 [Populus tomentosa]|uniref:EF-hand domain-containing protein n=1 Tax=Populus tomentosa TaxID=118781 RepID=A0A8X7XMT1_POPTO|nr:hypothetical protein POTOM_060982 [Populus tomentosa]
MATTESLVAQIQGLSSNAVDLGLLSIHLKKADEVLHNESTRFLAFLEQLDPTLHSLGNSVVVSDEIRGESLGVVWKTSIMQLVLDCNDYNEDGKLSFSEFSDLIKAFGNQKEELFKAADKNGDDAVSMDELAELPAFQQENEPLINCCPVCGEILEVSDKLNTLVHLSLCFDEGTGNQVMTGGFLTDKQASYGWMFKLSEWAHFSSYDVGLNSGSSASHILVVTTPMSSINAIAVEAFKKYILVSLIQNSQPYMEVASSYSSGKVSELETYSDKQGRSLKVYELHYWIMTLSNKLNAVDELLSCDPLYLAKAGRERQRFDFDDFDPVSQKFNI